MMYAVSDHQKYVITRSCRVTVLAAVLIAPCVGCQSWTRVQNGARATGRQIVDTLSPIADPQGGSISREGRQIEQNLSREIPY
ncbi:MAG: hypothetical protein R3E01_13825 [Pirellulaceae bacterium]|nr:hypothetical protein [Planctomycetales bacterium]